MARVVADKSTLMQIAELFSLTKISKALRAGQRARYLRQVCDVATNIEVSEVTVQDVLSRSYAILERNYRTEYVFKNNIATKIYLARQNPQRATLLNEFVVGCSIADLVMLSGRAHVYKSRPNLTAPQSQKNRWRIITRPPKW